MELKEIFKDNPDLLENESVKELIKYCEEKYNKAYNSYINIKNDYDDIIEVFLYSEVALKHGLNSKDTLLKIGKILSR